MVKKVINVLSVCGSGTVTSTMVANSVKDHLKDELKLTANTTTTRPTEAWNLVSGGNFDVIVHTSPLPKENWGIPVINATGLLTGFGEDEFYEELDDNIKKIIEE